MYCLAKLILHSVCETSGLRSWRGSNIIVACCCLCATVNQGFPPGIARPGVVSGELISCLFILMNVILLRLG